MSHASPAIPYDLFLAENPRRLKGQALEVGTDFTDAGGSRHRVCWYAETHELTFERIEPNQDVALDREDFHRGVATAEVVAQLDRDTLERIAGPWPQFDQCQPRTLARVRELLTFA